MASNGLRKWVKDRWVDIGAPKKNGKYQPCGRSKGSKRKYPKCVPLAKATQMTKSQKTSAVSRKRAAGNPGGKPTNVKTFAERKKASNGGSIRKYKQHSGENMKNKKNKIKKVIKGLKKASKLHAGQAKTLKKVISNGKKTR